MGTRAGGDGDGGVMVASDCESWDGGWIKLSSDGEIRRFWAQTSDR